MVIKIAHRGGAFLRPENTLEAFDYALQFNIDGVECDVHLCDNIPVVFHDDTLDRCTDGEGKISEVSFEYLRSRKICYHYHVPTLEETLCLVRNREDSILFLEIKSKLVDGARKSREDHYEAYPNIETKISDLLSASNMVKKTVVISFDWKVLQRIREKNPNVTTGILVSSEMANLKSEEGITHLISEAKKVGCRWINLDKDLLTSQSDDEVRSILGRLKGEFGVGVWTVNDYYEMLRLVRLGVEVVTSDHPELLSLL